jgi:hypothetical protein
VTDPSSTQVRSLRRFTGTQPFAGFKAQIDAVLAEQGAEGKKANGNRGRCGMHHFGHRAQLRDDDRVQALHRGLHVRGNLDQDVLIAGHRLRLPPGRHGFCAFVNHACNSGAKTLASGGGRQARAGMCVVPAW